MKPLDEITRIETIRLDIMGQAAGMALYQLLGGKSRDRIRALPA